MRSNTLQNFYKIITKEIKIAARNYPTKDTLSWLIEELEDSGSENLTKNMRDVLKLRMFDSEDFENFIRENQGLSSEEMDDQYYLLHKEEIDQKVEIALEKAYSDTISFLNSITFPLILYRRIFFYMNSPEELDQIKDKIDLIFEDHMGTSWSIDPNPNEKSNAYYGANIGLSTTINYMDLVVKKPHTQIEFVLTAISNDENDVDWETTSQIYVEEHDLQEVRLFPDRILDLKHIQINQIQVDRNETKTRILVHNNDVDFTIKT